MFKQNIQHKSCSVALIWNTVLSMLFLFWTNWNPSSQWQHKCDTLKCSVYMIVSKQNLSFNEMCLFTIIFKFKNLSNKFQSASFIVFFVLERQCKKNTWSYCIVATRLSSTAIKMINIFIFFYLKQVTTF